MIILNLDREPYWLQLMDGVRVHVLPATTDLVAEAMQDEILLEDIPSNQRYVLAFAKAVGRRAIIGWEGVGDQTGNPIEVTPEGIDALLDVFQLFTAFQEKYVSRVMSIEQEKNVSAPSPDGTSAGAPGTAMPARNGAESALPTSTGH